ncbi:MAG: M1 family metallopeptidase [Anaerolineae bacterium]|nr:M1 family metallopeptidase [Anaerolineae bacterium]
MNRMRKVIALLLLTTLLGAGMVRAEAPQPGADGLGDPLYPQLGNGGYDAIHYAMDLTADLTSGALTNTVTLDAKATQDLSAFNLDFVGFDITKLTVNGAPAEYTRSGHELTIKPAQPLTSQQPFTIVVSYNGVPKRSPSDPFAVGWRQYDKGVFVASEPSGAAGWYPVNDHPLDKATYTMRVTVDKPYVVAANGLLKDTIDNGNKTTYVWDTTNPVASYLVTVNIGKFTVDQQQGPNGLPIRSYFPEDITNEERTPFARMDQMIAYFNSIYGTYPFEAYGVVMADTRLGFALETQTLSLFGRNPSRQGQNQQSPLAQELTVAHELAHQWFGDSVSLKQWQDIWLNEGFATYSQFLWYEHVRGRQALDAQMIAVYNAIKRAGNEILGTIGKPSADRLFDQGVYYRGGLTLHALRLKVGDEAFFRIMRTYADRYRNSNASTADFINVAQSISGQDLDAFFNAWLHEPELPALPAKTATF